MEVDSEDAEAFLTNRTRFITTFPRRSYSCQGEAGSANQGGKQTGRQLNDKENNLK